MSVLALLALAGLGLFSGFAAGLIGIGGGVLIVPFLYFFYAHPAFGGFEFPAALHVTVAHATSLLVIVPTAIRGTYSYRKANLIAWQAALPIGIAALIGGVLGARIAVHTPAELLKLMFGAFLIASAVQLAFRKHRGVEGPLRTSLLITTLTGLAVGMLSGLMGVGGGILALPLLMYVIHVDIRRAAATSLVVVGVAATGGVVTYVLSGLGAPAMPNGSLGYVHFAAALPILVGALIAVPWGARLNQNMEVKALKWVFAVFFFVMGLTFVLENVVAVARML